MSHYDKQEERRWVKLKDDNSVEISAMGTSHNTDLQLTEEEWNDFAEDLKDIRDLSKANHLLYVKEFDDFYSVLEMGASKHGALNWLEDNGSKSSHSDMCASMFRHLAEASTGKTEDDESGLHPLLHLVTRALMLYTRQKRGIVHEEDK